MNYDDLSFWIMFAISGFLLILCGFLLYQLENKETELKQLFKSNKSCESMLEKADEMNLDMYRDREYLRQKLAVARDYLTQSVSVRIMNKDIRKDIREFLKGL